MTSILVTGAAGFIGTNFVRYWREQHPDDHVVALDALTYAGVRENVDGLDGVTFVAADIGDTDAVAAALEEHDVDRVVNFAAESHNSLAVLDPARFFRTNVLGTQGLCEAAKRAGVQRFHHVSTCEVYGDLALDTDEKFTEDSPYRPRTPYNASKAGGDHVVRAYHETWDLPVTITNCANNYGPYQFPGEGHPVLHDAGARRRATAALRVHGEPSGVDPRPRPLPGDRRDPRPGARSARPTTSEPASSAASSRSPTRSSITSASRRR